MSVAIFAIAVPMSLGIALATGAPLQAGLAATVVGGIVMGVLGTVPPQIGAATTGLVMVSAELVQRYGWRATCALIALVGLAQLALGARRMSGLAVSPSVAHGILAGIGMTIALDQLPVALSGSPDGSTPGNPMALLSGAGHPRLAALLVSTVTVAVLMAWPKSAGRGGRWVRAVPAPLAAVTAATAMSAGMTLPRLSLPQWQSRILPTLPHGPTLGIFAAVVTVTLVVSMESLRAAAVLDRSRAARKSTVPGALWVLLCAGLFIAAAGVAPLAVLAALVAAAGVKMVSFAHLKQAWHRREFPVYAAALGAVVALGALQGLALGAAGAAFLALRHFIRARITVVEERSRYRVAVDGQLTFLAVRRLSRALARVPDGKSVVIELGGSFMDHAAYEALQSWSDNHRAQGGWVSIKGRSGRPITEPTADHVCRPWTPWRNHYCTRPVTSGQADGPHGGRQLLGGVSAFQRNTAPLVRDELARLAREGQRPGELFLTCADSRLVTSMITSSGPGDLFTVRNVGNLMPPPDTENTCDSVGAAVEYAVEVLKVGSITVCGHSGCGAMQALLDTSAFHTPALPGQESTADTQTLLTRWLRHGRPSVARMQRIGRLGRGEVALAERPVADDVERLALVNVVQQLDHLMSHGCVARRVAEGSLHLHGMYFHVAEAQAYVLDRRSRTFAAVRPEVLDAV